MNNNYFKVEGSFINREETFHFDDSSKASARKALENAQEYRDVLAPGGKIVVFRASGFGRVRGVLEIGESTREARTIRPAAYEPTAGNLIGVPNPRRAA